MNPQEKLIGPHPVSPNFFGIWLQCEDCVIPPNEPNKKHRKLNEINGQRDAAIDNLKDWLINHHISESKLNSLRNIRISEIYNKHGLGVHAPSFPKWLPSSQTTRAGNAAEVLMSEYLQASSKMELLIYRLRYNPNVDQSMKGDDALLFNKNNLFEKVIVGEAKFRSSASGAAVDDIVKWMNTDRRYPISIGFVAEIIEKEDEQLSLQLYKLEADIHSARICPVINVGFYVSLPKISKTRAPTISDEHFKPNHPNAVMISLGLNSPYDVVEQAFNRAEQILKDEISNTTQAETS